MGQNPCALCGTRYLGDRMVAYHTFYPDGQREAWKQNVDPNCAKHGFSVVLSHGVKGGGQSKAMPSSCPACGDQDATKLETSNHSFFMGTDKRRYSLAVCHQCMAELRLVATHDAERLPDRGSEGRGRGDAFMDRVDWAESSSGIPW